MRLNIIVSKQRSDRFTTDPKDILIGTEMYWLSRNVVFMCHDTTGRSGIAEIDRSDGRFGVGAYEHGDKNLAINVYVVYPLNETPLLVGVMGKIYPKDDDKIIFELPLGDNERALNRARQNGFEVDGSDSGRDIRTYIDPDIIDITYHNGRQRMSDYPGIIYKKLRGKALKVFVAIDYTAGADDI